MQYTKITSDLLEEIKAAVGAANVFTDEESLSNYAHDETEDLKYFPEVVVKPLDTAAVSALLKLCSAKHVPVTPTWWRNRFKWCRLTCIWRSAVIDGKI